jgi:hypothetical protein
MFARGSLAAAILGLIATIGWTVQGLGNAFYYRQVGRLISIIYYLSGTPMTLVIDLGSPYGGWPYDGQGVFHLLSSTYCGKMLTLPNRLKPSWRRTAQRHTLHAIERSLWKGAVQIMQCFISGTLCTILYDIPPPCVRILPNVIEILRSRRHHARNSPFVLWRNKT